MRYSIRREDIGEGKSRARHQKTANQLTEDFDPISDIYDRRILFELSKRRIDSEDYTEDTSFEELDEIDFGDSGLRDNPYNNRSKVLQSEDYKALLLGEE